MTLIIRCLQTSDKEAICKLFKQSQSELMRPLFGSVLEDLNQVYLFHLLVGLAAIFSVLASSWTFLLAVPFSIILIFLTILIQTFLFIWRRKRKAFQTDIGNLVSYYLGQKGNMCIVAEEDGSVAGFAAFEKGSEDLAILTRLIVDPSKRRKKIGSILLQIAEQYASDFGYNKLATEILKCQRGSNTFLVQNNFNLVFIQEGWCGTSDVVFQKAIFKKAIK